MNTTTQNNINKSTKSTKQIAREAKIAKQDANKRTVEERQTEVNAIMAKFQELGIPNIMLGDFPRITAEFVEFGISFSGVIPLPDIKRELIYLLSNNRQHQCASMLKAL